MGMPQGKLNVIVVTIKMRRKEKWRKKGIKLYPVLLSFQIKWLLGSKMVAKNWELIFCFGGKSITKIVIYCNKEVEGITVNKSPNGAISTHHHVKGWCYLPGLKETVLHLSQNDNNLVKDAFFLVLLQNRSRKVLLTN
jgi:hypothetical protein